MKVFSAYVKENKKYKAENLRTFFGFGSDEKSNKDFINLLKTLKAAGVLKAEKDNNDFTSDKISENIIYESLNDDNLSNNEMIYSFSFVGIILYHDLVIYSYPKYIINPLDIVNDSLINHMKLVMKVIEKYSQRSNKRIAISEIDYFDEIDDKGKENILSVMLFLLEDYSSNGSYLKENSIVEDQGNGEILWPKTIDEIVPYIYDSSPYYLNWYSKRNVDNDLDYFKRLHEYVVTQCSFELKRIGLSDFYELPIVNISDEDESAFGDIDFISGQIDNELATTFDDRKITILKAMKAFFEGCRILSNYDGIQLIGTRKFNVIWEEVCAKIYQSQRDSLMTNLESNFKYDLNRFGIKVPTLLELIQKPKWSVAVNNGKKDLESATFKPDYLKIENDKVQGFTFYILDAKYYCPTFSNDKIYDQPGVEDVAKQYLYYLAYADFLRSNPEITDVKNYFIMPSKIDICVGSVMTPYINSVKLEILEKLEVLKNKNLDSIKIKFLDTEELYRVYLNNGNKSLASLDN